MLWRGPPIPCVNDTFLGKQICDTARMRCARPCYVVQWPHTGDLRNGLNHVEIAVALFAAGLPTPSAAALADSNHAGRNLTKYLAARGRASSYSVQMS